MSGPSPFGARALRCNQLAQDVRQNAAVLVVIDFDRGIDSASDRDGLGLSSNACDAQLKVLLRLESVPQAQDVIGLGAIEVKALRVNALLELERQHPHANQVRPMNPLET